MEVYWHNYALHSLTIFPYSLFYSCFGPPISNHHHLNSPIQPCKPTHQSHPSHQSSDHRAILTFPQACYGRTCTLTSLQLGTLGSLVYIFTYSPFFFFSHLLHLSIPSSSPIRTFDRSSRHSIFDTRHLTLLIVLFDLAISFFLLFFLHRFIFIFLAQPPSSGKLIVTGIALGS